MQTGIITKKGIFVECATWTHIATATRYDTEDQFALCKRELIDVVGYINTAMVAEIFAHCTRNNVILEDVMSADLEDQIAA